MRRRPLRAVLALMLTAALCLSGTAWAQPAKPSDAAKARAKKYAKEGDKLFSLGMFREAANAYQKAYVAKQVPALLYNIGQCYKRLGGLENLKKALFYYESYLNNLKQEQQRAELTRSIGKLKSDIKRLKAEKNKAPPFYKRWWFWTAVGVAVAGATVGTILATRPEDQQIIKGNVNPDVFELP